METTTLSVLNNFPQRMVAPDRLLAELRTKCPADCQIGGVQVAGDVVTVSYLVPAVPPADPDVVANFWAGFWATVGLHDGRPQTSDGKQIVLSSMFPGDVLLYRAGRGDDLPLGRRGEGPQILLQSDRCDDPLADPPVLPVTFDVRFRDAVYLAGGELHWEGGGLPDGIDLQALAPATLVTSTPGTGNVNLSGPKLVPAPLGDGTHTVNLTQKYGSNVGFVKATPVPASKANGWFDYDDDQHVLTVNSEQHGAYNLYTIDVQIARQVRDQPILGAGRADLTMPAVKAKKMLPQWILRVTLHNESGQTIGVRVLLLVGRAATT